MLVVREVYVEGFKGVRRLTRPLELKKFNVLVGRNNAGKTSILEALFLIAEPYLRVEELEGADKWRLNLYHSVYGGGSAPHYILSLHGATRFSGLVYGYWGDAVVTYALQAGSRLTVKIGGEGGVELNVDGRKVDYVEAAKALGLSRGRVPALYIPNATKFYNELKERLAREDVWVAVEAEGYNVEAVEKLYAGTLPDALKDGASSISARRSWGGRPPCTWT